MSFILDALRKSEAARRRNEAPDLFAAMPQAVEPVHARPAWPLWALGVGGALALLAALWLVADRPAASDTTPQVAIAPSAVPPPATTPAPSAVVETPPSTAVPSQVAPLPTPPPMPGPTPATIANIGPAPSANTAPAASAAPAPPREEPTPPVAEVAPAPAPPASPAPPSAPDHARIASLAELDPETRKQLPPLKLSMHLWNETAARRFVILDGQRLKEGDVLGDVVIEQITRDGAVLAWRGARLRLQR